MSWSTVFARKMPPNANQAVPLAEVHVDHGRPRLDSHDGGVHLGRRPEVILPNLQDVRRPRQELSVHRQATVERIPRVHAQTHRELSLEHQRRRPEHRPVRQELEHERRRDLVRTVGDAHVEVRQVHLEEVAADYLQIVPVRRPGDAALELDDHARVELDRDDFLRRLEEAHREVPGPRADLEDDVRGLDPALLDDGVDDHRVLEDVLPVALQELNALVRRLLRALLLDVLRDPAGDADAGRHGATRRQSAREGGGRPARVVCCEERRAARAR
eukprot:212-Pelagococcus_subviridis.AAC.3